MKHIKLIAALFFIGLSALSGCTPSGGGGASPTFAMTANVGSYHLNCSVCVAGLVGGIMGIAGSTVGSGGVGGPPELSLSLAGWTGSTGTYTLTTPSSTSNSFAAYTVASGSLSVGSQTGTVVITSISTTVITGTFS